MIRGSWTKPRKSCRQSSSLISTTRLWKPFLTINTTMLQTTIKLWERTKRSICSSSMIKSETLEISRRTQTTQSMRTLTRFKTMSKFTISNKIKRGLNMKMNLANR